MKLIPSSASHSSIEPLEGRIAPATIQIGATGGRENRNDTEYIEQPYLPPGGGPPELRDPEFALLNFVDTSTGTDQISMAVDSSAPNSPNTYYLRLNAGDKIDRFTDSNNYENLVDVRSGTAIVFFTDLDGDNEFDANELTGVSLSANAVVEINGPVNGDIVTNFDTKGTPSPADDVIVMNGLVGPKQGIKSLSVVGGGIAGSVLSGGDISAITVRGNVDNVLAGNAANGASFDFFVFPLDPNPRFVVGFAADAGIKGASIRNAEIVSLTDRLEAGSGGAGAAGGSLSNIQIVGDSDGFSLIAGKGGDASTAAFKNNGGAGGSATKIYVAGLSDGSNNSPVLIQAGAGGSVEPLVFTGKGGAGGLVNDVRVGFEVSGGRILPSANLLHDNIRVESGDGGAGLTGGAGGKISSVNIRVSTTDGIVAGDEIAVVAGTGGAAVALLGKAGAGGAVDKIEIRNQEEVLAPPLFSGDILVQGGSGGTVIQALSTAGGAAGGAVTNLKLLGADLRVVAGDGSTGKTGGNGGAVRSITVLDADSVLPRSIDIHTGFGGNGTAGNGGAGGDLFKVQVPTSDLGVFTVNGANGGNGGNSTGGKGGKGGSVNSVSVIDIDSGFSLGGTFLVRAGNGGNGDFGGGAGGSITALDVDAKDLHASVTAGAGGDANVGGTGRGGAGGALSNVEVTTSGSVAGANVTGLVASGDGGDGVGVNQSGGKGGDVRKAQLNLTADIQAATPGDGTVRAGDGGSGAADTGAAGAGGSLFSALVFAQQGSATMTAGDAGAVGGKAGNGGNIVGTTAIPSGVRGSQNITVRAGDGSYGGAGGSITNLNYGNGDPASNAFTPPPAGSILIEAGNGSQGDAKAGKGGSITSVNGAASSGVGQSVVFLAGDGGGDARPAGGPSILVPSGKAAAGGSITNVTLNRGGAAGGLVTFEAGDAGDSTTARAGAAGGSISKLAIAQLSTQAVLRSIAAGDGGDAAPAGGKGGKGGSVTDVQVLDHDIGVRTGEYFGYERMGGIFAGAGGNAFAKGTAGSVTNISADSIASIVAGKSNTPDFVEKISDITLNANNQLLFRNNSFVPNSPFELTFNGQTSATLPGNASASQLQAALNALSGVADAGGVTVMNFTQDGGYVIQFGSQQNASVDSTPTAIDYQLALNAMPTVVAKGGVTAMDEPNGSVTVTFNGNNFNIPAPVASQQTTATQIAAALNGSGLNAFGAFGVAAQPNGDYRISYNTFGLGDQAEFTGTEFVPVKLLEKVQGQIAQLITNEARKGEIVVTADETLSGSDPITVQEFQRGELNYISVEVITGDQTAEPPVAEIQRINLSSLNTFPSSQFTVNFEGEESAPIPVADINGVLRSDDQIRQDIDDALEGLSSIAALTGGTALNRVQVVITDVRTFEIRFDALDGDVEQIIGRFLLPEVQRLNIASLQPVPNSEFRLSFEGATTPYLQAGGVTFADIDTALENLPTIQAIPGGLAFDQVEVNELSPGVFEIIFNAIGNQQSLSGETSVIEFQSLDLSSVFAIPGNSFRLNFDGALTFLNETTPVLVAGADDAATAQIIEDALNQLDSVQDTGPNGFVDVTVAGPNRFAITFQDNGERAEIVAIATIDEIQTIDVSSINTIVAADFVVDVRTTLPVLQTQQFFIQATLGLDSTVVNGLLPEPTGGPGSQWDTTVIDGTTTAPEIFRVDRSFFLNNPLNPNYAPDGRITFSYPGPNGPLTATINANATAGQIDTAIESIIGLLDVIITAPGATAALPTGQIPTTFDIRFSGNADRVDLSAQGFIPETQRFDLSNAFPGSFTVFHYNNGPIFGDTIVLPNTPGDTPAERTQLQNALNAIIPGGVTVVSTNNPGNPHEVDITFNIGANIPANALTFTQEMLEVQQIDLTRLIPGNSDFTLTFNGQTTVFLPENASAGAIEAAIEALPGAGDVSVTVNGELVDVAFNSLRGDLPTLEPQARLGTGRTSVLASDATAAEIDAALDLVTIGGVTVTAGLNGTFAVSFNDAGDQPAMIVTTSIQEIQTLDVYDIGQFSLNFQPMAFGVTAGNTLVSFDPNNPSSIETSDTITGLQPGETILGLDFRQGTEQLYALGSTGRIYTIDFTGPIGEAPATEVGTGPLDVTLLGTNFGFDFNPTVDRIRLVSDVEQNLRIHPGTGLVVDTDPNTSGTQIDTPLAYAAGDVNAGQNPNIVAVAYDRADNDPNTPTTLYGIDATLGVLVRIGGVDGTPSPNGGEITTIGSLTGIVGAVTGFDIRNGVAYLTSDTGVSANLRTVNLATGATTNLGTVFADLTSVAITTTLLNPPPRPVNPLAPTVDEVAALNASAQALENVLSAQPGVRADGGVQVVPSERTVLINGNLEQIYEDTSYQITFGQDGDLPLLSGTQFETMIISTSTPGGPSTREQQTIRYFPKSSFNPVNFAQANLVGAIVDIDERDAKIFHYLDLTAPFGEFNQGDQPLDGIVMAKVFNQATVNFTPEARLTLEGFFDNDNLL